MHIDPLLTDAFNALISGEKWWVSLPKDLYEFRDEFKCDSLCSDVPNNFHKLIGVWFVHILPQIRYSLDKKVRRELKAKINIFGKTGPLVYRKTFVKVNLSLLLNLICIIKPNVIVIFLS